LLRWGRHPERATGKPPRPPTCGVEPGVGGRSLPGMRVEVAPQQERSMQSGVFSTSRLELGAPAQCGQHLLRALSRGEASTRVITDAIYPAQEVAGLVII
jgi:hypothetical protein